MQQRLRDDADRFQIVRLERPGRLEQQTHFVRESHSLQDRRDVCNLARLALQPLDPAFELQAKRRRGGAGDSDADQLSRLTHVPAGLWLFLFHAVSLCSLIGGGRWLLEV